MYKKVVNSLLEVWGKRILFTKDKRTIIKEGGYDSFGIIYSLCFVLKKQQI